MEHAKNAATTVTYGEEELILTIKTPLPGQALFSILKGINVAMRESLFCESLTQEDKNGLAALGQLAIDILDGHSADRAA